MTDDDKINHPAHYTRLRITIEPIDLCELLPFCLGNTCKYLMRAGFKEGESASDDYKKAAWYLDRAIENLPEDDDILIHSPAAALIAKKFEDSCPLLGYLFDFTYGGITHDSAVDTLGRILADASSLKREEEIKATTKVKKTKKTKKSKKE